MQDVEQLRNEAGAHFSAGRYQKAEKLYRKVLESAPGDFQVLLMIGTCRQHRRDLEGALAIYRQAVEAGDNESVTHFHLGRQYIEMRKIYDGRESLAQAIALDPNHAPARSLMGYSFIMTGDYQRAIDELKVARRADPHYPPAVSMLALALLKSGQVEEAAKEANRAIQLAPDDPGTHSVLGNVLLAQEHGYFAEQCFRSALERHPDHLELQAGLGRALSQTRQWAEAIQVLEGVLNGGLRTPDIGMAYARALAGQERIDEAITLLDHMPDQSRDEAYWVLLADLKFIQGDRAGAREALDALPDSHAERALLGARLCMSEGGPAKAVALLEPLLEHEDRAISRRARLASADAYLVDGDSESAYEVLEPMFVSERPDRRAVDIWSGFLYRDRRWEALIAFIEPMLRKLDLADAVRARATGLLVTALDAAGQVERAAEQLEAAAWREPDFLQVYSSEASQQMRDALMNVTDEQWREPDSATGETPVFVFGWPGSGQRELIATLAGSTGVQVLPNEHLSERARIYLGLSMPEQPPLPEDTLADLRGQCVLADTWGGGCKLDPASYEVATLPGIARLFPGATVIVISSQEADLHLHWMMSGYKRPLDILDAYRREREVFQHLQDKLPLNFVVLSRHRLLGETEKTLESLYDRLGLDWDGAIAGAFSERAEAAHLRPDGHWKRYAAVLGRD